MKRLKIIEFLKGYSIFTIIAFHYLQHLHLQQPLDQLIFFGGTGVHLFILLSGLGLYLSYLSNPLPYLAYLKKRTSKIYFPYICIVVISALISLVIPIYDNSLYALGGHVFLYKMFDERIMGSYGYPLWFISTILQFYFIFYALVFLVKRLGNIPFLCLSLAISLAWTVIIIAFGKESERIWNSFFLRYLWEFSLGMVIASVLTRHDYRLPFKPRTAWFLVAGLINCALYAFLALKGGVIGKLMNDIPALIGYGCIAIWIYRVQIGAVNRFFLFTGRISYSLYLIHVLILQLSLSLLSLPPILVISLSLVITYLLSVPYQQLMEYNMRGIGAARKSVAPAQDRGLSG
jgi:peptidoglycan/LPS O-acetylase OafA/YrhL